MEEHDSMPWIEKYRPNHFDDIVLDPLNRAFFRNIIEKNHFSNLLFYGPPGTGKTTTIINLINEYQDRWSRRNKESVIHLNASDERGIDIIRTQINQFVKSKHIFEVGMKFVILDEVDYMTKTAQQALKTLLQTCKMDVRFCLICNYISKIDDSLQTMFIKIKFNKLPKEMILNVLETIVRSEKLTYTRQQLEYIQILYESDIRSMINCLQLNQDNPGIDIIHTEIWDRLYQRLRAGESVDKVATEMYNISQQYNMDIKHILKEFVYHVWSHYTPSIPISHLDNAFHHSNINPDHMLRHVLFTLN
jgi:replication factor C subunit 3/5